MSLTSLLRCFAAYIQTSFPSQIDLVMTSMLRNTLLYGMMIYVTLTLVLRSSATCLEFWFRITQWLVVFYSGFFRGHIVYCSYTVCTFSFADGSSIGVAISNFFSFGVPSAKNPLGIDVHQTYGGQRFGGLRNGHFLPYPVLSLQKLRI